MLYDVYLNGKLTWTGINWDTVSQRTKDLLTKEIPADELPLKIDIEEAREENFLNN